MYMEQKNYPTLTPFSLLLPPPPGPLSASLSHTLNPPIACPASASSPHVAATTRDDAARATGPRCLPLSHLLNVVALHSSLPPPLVARLSLPLAPPGDAPTPSAPLLHLRALLRYLCGAEAVRSGRWYGDRGAGGGAGSRRRRGVLEQRHGLQAARHCVLGRATVGWPGMKAACRLGFGPSV